MQNIWYDLYISNGGLVPRSLIIKETDVTLEKRRSFFARKRKTILKVEQEFARLSRMGNKVDEIRDTHPLVELILKEFLQYEQVNEEKRSRSERPDFVARAKNYAALPVEAKAFDKRDLSSATGSKPNEMAPDQLTRYILTKDSPVYGSLDIGILTNGRDWRLQDSKGNYVEFDLEAMFRDVFDPYCPWQAEVEGKLMLFFRLFGYSGAVRRKLLFEGATIWADSYTEFRKRYNLLLDRLKRLYKDAEERATAKEISLWLIFIRSLEDLGVLPASPHKTGSTYTSYQLLSPDNWSKKYRRAAKLRSFLNSVANNEYAKSNREAFTEHVPDPTSLTKWKAFHESMFEFLYSAEGSEAFDFGDLYSREFGIIYVNLECGRLIGVEQPRVS